MGMRTLIIDDESDARENIQNLITKYCPKLEIVGTADSADSGLAKIKAQDPDLVRGLHIGDKTVRVANYQRNTVESFMEILGAAGLTNPDQLRPEHIQRRISQTQVASYAEIYDYLQPGALLADQPPQAFEPMWRQASADQF